MHVPLKLKSGRVVKKGKLHDLKNLTSHLEILLIWISPDVKAFTNKGHYLVQSLSLINSLTDYVE